VCGGWQAAPVHHSSVAGFDLLLWWWGQELVDLTLVKSFHWFAVCWFGSLLGVVACSLPSTLGLLACSFCLTQKRLSVSRVPPVSVALWLWHVVGGL
jgi:hypothetical protein